MPLFTLPALRQFRATLSGLPLLSASLDGLGANRLPFLAAYLACGLLHEAAHVTVASAKLTLSNHPLGSLEDLRGFVARAVVGRHCFVELDDLSSVTDFDRLAIRIAGFVFSLVLAVWLHYLHASRRSTAKGAVWNDAGVVVAAYATALESMATDLLGLVPLLGRNVIDEATSGLVFFCGNFGVLLLNPSWINVDGGKRALDMLEKMVEVTMMRGAQSGGVVTYEPATSGSTAESVPVIRGKRSRVVNAKRTVLSRGVRSKIEKDNCSTIGKNLSGWNAAEFNANDGGKRLVRAFFGHTRFATTSKATFDGTHPHTWSPRANYTYYPVHSDGPVTSKVIGVENFITHNGDFEFFKVSEKYYDTEAIQKFIVKALHVPMETSVDSAAIAGMMDLLRCQGCFALSARYAVCFMMDVDPMDPSVEYPSIEQHREVGRVFEKALDGYVAEKGIKSLKEISASEVLREELANNVKVHLAELATSKSAAVSAFAKLVSLNLENGDLGQFARTTIDAFLDNDLLHSMRLFLENAKGSFGLCVTTSLDSHRQAVFAAKGQTLSIAFYPRKGVICYGSEQAAVKAGLNFETPEGRSKFGNDYTCQDSDAVRLDLDDLGGEICLLDWGYGGDNKPAISPPNRRLAVEKLMGSVNVTLLHQEDVMQSSKLKKRLIPLENNECIKPLLDDCVDPVMKDIADIPKILNNIQEDWQGVGMNRMTAWHLAQCIKQRVQGYVDGTIESHANQVDIIVTGCEEAFVADLNKCFPKLGVKAVSSNKLLGLFGQDLSMPAVGFPYTPKTLDMRDPIVIIVSHSGGTFAPLACSNLLQSFSSSIFAVCSEWDTQVGKQLRTMFGDVKEDLFTSRIFSTEVGVRPAEPCSLSVVATHQLLTNVFEHIALTILSDPHHRFVTGAVINESDLQTLERCNQDNIKALECIVGVDRSGNVIKNSETEKELRGAGDLWSEHILENAKAYIMTFVYIMVTVTIGFPLVTGIAFGAGLAEESSIFYLTRAIDGLIYFWLPQINIIILRLVQARDLRHRMVGRTVVVGDCPWVAQAAEAFLGKIFACSYSIAGLNVLSGNPADHLVHRHTHRVVRGSLLVCGRPDGRLPALTTMEASTCLAVNQASSIQSIGGTCESITIGHNKSKLPLTKMGIFLETFRPQFLSERLLEQETLRDDTLRSTTGHSATDKRKCLVSRSSSSLLGAYSNMEKESKKVHEHHIDSVIHDMIKESKGTCKATEVFHAMDKDGSGSLGLEEFISAYKKINPSVSITPLAAMFEEADLDGNGSLELGEFLKFIKMSPVDMLGKLSVQNRDSKGLAQVKPSKEEYFGETLRKTAPMGVGSFSLSASQHLSMELYESRVASMQRFVAMCVMFHQIGHRVQSFFPKISFGLLGYRMDRTHSIMRIATTASPVSGADVREQMVELALRFKVLRSVKKIARVWRESRSRRRVGNGGKDE